MLRNTTFFLAGLLLGTGLLVYDEILTLAMYCGRSCLYRFPLIGAYGLYTASYLPFSLIVLAGILLVLASGKNRPV